MSSSESSEESLFADGRTVRGRSSLVRVGSALGVACVVIGLVVFIGVHSTVIEPVHRDTVGEEPESREDFGRFSVQGLEKAMDQLEEKLEPWKDASADTDARNAFCNVNASLSGPVKPNFIELHDPYWKKHCYTNNKGKHWQPPAWVGFQRNWCWAAVKMAAQMTAWHDKEGITPGNYWTAQIHAHRHFQAPHPKYESLIALHHRELCDVPEHGGYFGPPISTEERAAAEKWLSDNVGIYIMNIDRAWLRMQRITARMKELNINFTRIPGVDLGGGPAVMKKKQEEGVIPLEWSYDEAKQNLFKLYGQSNKPSIYGEVAGIGTVGCAAAHLNTMKEAAELSLKNGKPLTLILEDDVSLYIDFAPNLRRMLEAEAPCDWEAISLKSYNPVGDCVSAHLSRVWPDGDEPAISCRRAANWGFQSMLYRSDRLLDIRSKLQKVVWNVSAPTCLVQDIALATLSTEINFYAVPACQKPGFVSFMRDPKGAGIRENINKK